MAMERDCRYYNNAFHSAPESLLDIQGGRKMQSYLINLQHHRLSFAQLFHSSELQRRCLRPGSCLWKNKGEECEWHKNERKCTFDFVLDNNSNPPPPLKKAISMFTVNCHDGFVTPTVLYTDLTSDREIMSCFWV